MTKKVMAYSKSGFSGWLRGQREIKSDLGYVATDIDYIWRNHKTGKWMILEEKAKIKDCGFPDFKSGSSWSQHETLKMVHNYIRTSFSKGFDKHYMGIHLILFEDTTPDNGRIWLNNEHNELTRDGLIEFLRFEGIHHYTSGKPCYVCGGKRLVRLNKSGNYNLCDYCVMYLRVLFGVDKANEHYTQEQMARLIEVKRYHS